MSGKIPDIFSMEEKVIIVTGGTKKYGYYFCEALAEAGGTVIITSRDKKKSTEKAKMLTDRGLKTYGYEMDLADDNSINNLVTSVIKSYGKIDVLVNNARYIPQLPYYDINREELDKAFTINSVGLILLTRRVAEEMKRAGQGNIINISSIYGIVGQDISIYKEPEQNIGLDYSVQKGGIIAYTRQLATILARYNVRSNCLTLGGLRETAPDDPYFLEQYNRHVPLGRMAIPDDIKGPIVFLASDASKYMTGANLIVDGGWTAW